MFLIYIAVFVFGMHASEVICNLPNPKVRVNVLKHSLKLITGTINSISHTKTLDGHGLATIRHIS